MHATIGDQLHVHGRTVGAAGPSRPDRGGAGPRRPAALPRAAPRRARVPRLPRPRRRGRASEAGPPLVTPTDRRALTARQAGARGHPPDRRHDRLPRGRGRPDPGLSGLPAGRRRRETGCCTSGCRTRPPGSRCSRPARAATTTCSRRCASCSPRTVPGAIGTVPPGTGATMCCRRCALPTPRSRCSTGRWRWAPGSRSASSISTATTRSGRCGCPSSGVDPGLRAG